MHWLPFLGDVSITDITREQLKRFMYEKLNAGLSRSSVKNYFAPLSEMFNHAVEDGHVNRNPCIRIMRTTREEKGKQQQKVDFLTRAELASLLATCREHFAPAYPFVLLIARTGLRIGEAVALQWHDIDFHGRFLTVQRNWVDGTLTTPKSGKGRRVDMSRMLTEILTALLVERKKETLKKGWGEVPHWVFTTAAGSMMDPDNFRKRVWPKLLAKAGMRKIRIHDLRHSFACLFIQQGESLVYVKEQMGHHSIRVTVDVYGHLVPGGNKAAVDKLDDNSHEEGGLTYGDLSKRGKSWYYDFGHKDIAMTMRYAHLWSNHKRAAMEMLESRFSAKSPANFHDTPLFSLPENRAKVAVIA